MARLVFLALLIVVAVLGSAPAGGSNSEAEVSPAYPTAAEPPPSPVPPETGESSPAGAPAGGGLFGGASPGGYGSAASGGRREMEALARAYPERIAEVALRDGQWALRVGERWFSWASGRLLPEELREDWGQYAPHRFYDYPYHLPPLPRLGPAERERLEAYLAESRSSPPERHGGFLGALYRAETRAATEARLVTVAVLGHEVRVHEEIAGPLRAVASRLELLQRQEPEVREFFEGIDGLAGYNWRPIAGTRTRSYHGYAAAVDLVPRSYGGKHAYWRWAMEQGEQWYSLPYASRWMVPPAVVRAFEAEGFIWGGKWLFFDTMHFEYRPEILLLSSQARRFGWGAPASR